MKFHFLIFATICLFQSLTGKADTIDNYQVYIRKVLVRNDGGFPREQKNKSYISISKTLCNESLELHFNHCTRYVGKRNVLIVDKHNKVLKEFEFTDAKMNIPISFFCESPQIKSEVSYSLIYYDTVVGSGRLLTDIQIKK